MSTQQLVVGVAAALTGLMLVGPWVSRVVLWWIGRRVALPLFLGYAPAPRSTGWSSLRCRRCERELPRVVLRQRCPGCGEGTARWMSATAVVTAVVFGVSGWRFGASVALLPVLLLATGLVAVSAIDVVYWRIPTQFVYAMTVAVGGAVAVVSWVGGELASLVGAGVGAGGYFGLLAFLYLVSRGKLGLGDVRLAVPMGMTVGWMAWSSELPVSDPLGGVLQAALLGSLIAMVPGVVLLVVRRRSEPYPFGPWLSLGTWVAILLAAPGPL